MQELLIVLMLLTVNYLGGLQPSSSEILLQLIGGGMLLGLMIWQNELAKVSAYRYCVRR